MNTLRQAAQEYVTMRRDLGFKFTYAGKALLEFTAFMRRRRCAYITSELALDWAQLPTGAAPAHRARRLSVVRGFARYRSAADPRTQIPPPGLLRFQPRRARPYLYSDEEIRRLLRAALAWKCRCSCDALKPYVFHCLFGLLSVSGLRASEALNLRIPDLDLEEKLLTVRGTKFGKDRLVPLHASTCHVLQEYLVRRRQHFANREVSSYVFVSNRGNRLDGAEVRRTFYALSRQVGLRGANDSHGPRLHDMRHRFATGTLVRWYRRGQDPQRLLPVLSAYLGHVHVEDTQWYLDGCPELMREAMRRLERCWEDRP